jgi:hypothetical protein
VDYHLNEEYQHVSEQYLQALTLERVEPQDATTSAGRTVTIDNDDANADGEWEDEEEEDSGDYAEDDVTKQTPGAWDKWRIFHQALGPVCRLLLSASIMGLKVPVQPEEEGDRKRARVERGAQPCCSKVQEESARVVWVRGSRASYQAFRCQHNFDYFRLVRQ